MSYSVEHIATAIKAAREKRELSQRALGAKIGIPQSHISKIENGAVDLKASSLIALSRALDLELMLVPRVLVPAVKGLQRGTEAQGPSQRAAETTIKSLAKVGNNARRLTRRFPRTEEFERLWSTIRDLQQLRLTVSQAGQIGKLLDQIDAPMKAIKQQQDTIANHDRTFLDRLDQIDRATRDLRYLRNALVHGLNESGPVSLPAYRLDEEENDA